MTENRKPFRVLLPAILLFSFLLAATAWAATPMVSVGNSHSAALKADGTVLTWGYNGRGQLGNGTTTDQLKPAAVPGLSGAIAVAAGWGHTVALKSDGTVLAWGENGQGQLGDGTTTRRLAPTAVAGLTGVVAIAAPAAGQYTVALKSDGTVVAWGDNSYGQLGDGSTTTRLTPTPVPGLTGVVAVATGNATTVALKSDGTVAAWGYNDDGELGDGTTTHRASPVTVPGLSGVIAVAAGGGHTMALKSDGTVYTWGYNYYGQLGDGTTTLRLTPVPVPGLTGVVALAGGYQHSLALKSDGTVLAWGWNDLGQLGDGTTTHRYSPKAIPGLTEVAALAAGWGHSAAARSDGTVASWGYNGSGQLGDGSSNGNVRTTPLRLPGVLPGEQSKPRFAYVANYSGNTVSIYTADGATGALRHSGYVPAGTNPMSVAVDPAARFAYAANYTSGEISVYRINRITGALSAGDPVTGNVNPRSVTVDPAGRFAYVPSTWYNDISVYAIDQNSGALSAAFYTPAKTQPVSFALDPAGRFAYAANFGSADVSVYTVNQSTGALTPGTAVAAGTGPISIQVEPTGRFAYVANYGSDSVSVYTINQSSGALSPGTAVATGTGPQAVAVDPSGRFAYVANYGSDSVSVYRIDQTTGALSGQGSVATVGGPASVSIDGSGRFAYVAGYAGNFAAVYEIDQESGALTLAQVISTRQAPISMVTTGGSSAVSYLPKFAYAGNLASNDVSLYAVNGASGELSPLATAPAGTQPTSVTADPSGRFLYAANYGSANVSAYSIHQLTGALTPAGTAAAGTNPQSVAVDPSGRFAYVANYGSASVSAYSINGSTGALSAAGQAATGQNPSAVGVEPSGRFAYVASYWLDNVAGYAINPSTGALTALAGSPFAAGTSPMSVAVDPTGKFVLAANRDSDSVSVYAINPISGALIQVSGSPFAAGGSPISAAVEPSGRFAYVANSDSDDVSAYHINPNSGALTALPGSPFAAGTTPESVSVDPSGRFAYVANRDSNDVSIYQIDRQSGALTPLGTAAAGSKPYSIAVSGMAASTATGAPDAPTRVTATTGGSSQVTVSFSPPTNPGGSAVTGYTVTASPGGATATGTSGVIAVNGLPGGTTYTFTVAALNSYGTGAASAPSNPVTLGRAGQGISFGAAPALVVGASIGVSASASSGLTVSLSSLTPLLCTVDGISVSALAAGTCVIAANQAGNESFLPASQATQSIVISKRGQTLSFGDAPELGLGGSASVSASASSGLAVSLSSLTPAVCSITGTTVTNITWGTCTIAADQAGDAYYQAAPRVTLSLIVLKPKTDQTVSLTVPSRILVGVSAQLSATASSGLAPSYSSLTPEICSVAGNSVTGIAPGTCRVAANQAGDADFNPAPEAVRNIGCVQLLAGAVQSPALDGAGTASQVTVSTLAGSAPTSGSTDGTGGAARFRNPLGITTDGTNLYLTDSYNHTIRRVVIATGQVTTLAGSAGTSGSSDGTGAAARFKSPSGITTDGSNLYVLDSGNYTIRKMVIATGVVTTLAGTAGSYGYADGVGGAARFAHSSGITTDGSNLYVVDNGSYVVRKVVIATGAVTTLAGTPNASGSSDGTGAAARFYYPQDVTTDGSNLYVTDRFNATIRKVVIATGAVTTIAGSPGAYGRTDAIGTAARFKSPLGITSDGSNLYVTELHRVIRKIVLATGEVSTLAGTLDVIGSTDGAGTVALFYNPACATTDGTSLFIADQNNHTVRKISALNQAALSPAALSFGSRQVGSAGAPQTVTLSHSGGAGLGIASIVTSGDYSHSTTCGSTLAAGESCTISVSFAPTAPGERSGALTVTSDAEGSPHLVVLSGSGFGAPGAPAMGTVTAGNAEAVVSFAPPASDGGSPVTGYTVSSSPAGGIDIDAGSTSLSHTVTGLANGTAYSFTVTATNSAGTGPASDPSFAVTPARAQQSISFGAASALVVGGSANLSASASSGLPVGFSSTTPGVCTVSGATVSALSAGTCTVAADQPGNAFYQAAPRVTQDIGVLAPPPVNGVCGSSNGGSFTSAPAAGLCSTGTAGPLSGSGPWSWFCTGTDGGVTVQCSTDRQASAAPGSILTLAGGGSGDGGPATSASLGNPTRVAVDGAGNQYLADTSNHCIRRIEAGTGVITTVAGNGTAGFSGDGGPAHAASLYSPYGVALDSAGNLYIADANNHRIRKVAAGTGIITTVAGNGNYTFAGGDDGPAISASLYTPVGVALDGSGNLYIADLNNRRIRKVAAGSGTITTVAGNGSSSYSGDGGPALLAGLASPYGVALDGAGNLYVADSGSHRVRRVAADSGIMTTVAGNGTAAFAGDGGPADGASLSSPSTVALDGAGNLYIADAGNQRVRQVAVGTGIIGTVAGTGAASYAGDGGHALQARLRNPQGVALDAEGNLYIADTFNNRLRRVAAGTGIIGTVAGNGWASFDGDGGDAGLARLSSPYGVALDGAGNLYLADTGNHRIRKVASGSGVITTVAGNGTAASAGDGGNAVSASIYSPAALAVDGAGNIYIADANNHRIRKVSAGSGIISTVAGTGAAVFCGDGGPAGSACVANPSGLALDGAGNLYLVDSGNSRIRRIAADTGIISTLAGNGSPGFSGDGGPATSASIYISRGALALDQAGNLYFADQRNHRIRRVAAGSGIISTVAGNGSAGFAGDGGPATSAALTYPTGVAVSGAGDLYIADQNNHRIRRVSAVTGVITSVAGTGSAAFAGDGGPAAGASLSYPASVVLDGAGNLYLADSANNRIRKILAVPPPAAETTAATSVSASGAVLGGTVDDRGTSTSVSFEYGVTTGYGGTLDAGTVTAGSGPTVVGAALGGLSCGTTYHFRVVGMNGGGAASGADQSFSTGACPAPATARLQVTVDSVDGGGGSVHSAPAGIACLSGSCSADFSQGEAVTLIAAADGNSLFDGWAGACFGPGGNCTLTMGSGQAVTARFAYVPPARTLTATPSYFGRLQAALGAAVSGGTVQARDFLFTENLVWERGMAVTLNGGYNTGYTSTMGVSSLKGTLKIRSGTLRVNRLRIR